MPLEKLKAALSQFESVLDANLRPYVAPNIVVATIRELFATRSAWAVLSCTRAAFGEEYFAVCAPGHLGDESQLSQLPSVEDVRSAAPTLVDAVSSLNLSGTIEALKALGVFALCPSSEQQFTRLELRVRSIVGRVQLVPLIELAIFAAECGLCKMAGIYIAEAHSLSPGPPELHSLHTASGIVALSDGYVAEANRYLAESVRVCHKDGLACLLCATRSQNLVLAARLLHHGQSAAVKSYLMECLDVWKQESRRIRSWINVIDGGEVPDFEEFGRPQRMLAKLRELVTASDFLAVSLPESSGQEEVASVDQMVTRFKRLIGDAVKGKLDTGKN